MTNSPTDSQRPYAESAETQDLPHHPLPAVLHYALQPALIVLAMGIWLRYPEHPMTYLYVLAGVQVLLFGLERWRPARRHWQQPPAEKWRNLAIVLVGFTCSVLIAVFYAQMLSPTLGEWRNALHINVWPTHWPLAAQVLLSALLSEFIWYWFHRAEHRWALVWKLSGHGAHHSFKHLEAINFGANHPMEYFVLLVPALLVEVLFGAGIAAAGSAMLIGVLAGIAHSNLDLNTRVIDWLFTTNKNHIHHHSMVLEESNTNYGCGIILWDRLFGTFANSATLEAGIGPTEPTLLQKLLMPVQEPRGSQIAPGGKANP